MPFSAGKRNCAGQNLAMLELKLVLAHLLDSFAFRVDDEHHTLSKVYFLTMKPVDAFLYATPQE